MRLEQQLMGRNMDPLAAAITGSIIKSGQKYQEKQFRESRAIPINPINLSTQSLLACRVRITHPTPLGSTVSGQNGFSRMLAQVKEVAFKFVVPKAVVPKATHSFQRRPSPALNLPKASTAGAKPAPKPRCLLDSTEFAIQVWPVQQNVQVGGHIKYQAA